MPDLSTTYMGLELRNPIIVGSSGLTDKPEKIIELEKHGAAAVVLKSIFEEEISMEYEQVVAVEAPGRYKDDYLDYFDYKIKETNVDNYLELISQSRKAVKIPVIASVNCTTAHEWTYFAKKIQEAGANALELNIFILPSDLTRPPDSIEKAYFDIVNKVREEIRIPVALKMGYFFSNLGGFIQELSRSNINALVLFNRTYNLDIDIDHMKVTSAEVLSSPGDLSNSLRWIAIMSNRVKCDLAASTGIHDGKAIIKQLLAGARAVQVVSALYQKGPAYISTMLKEIEGWMEKKGYGQISDFMGMMSQERQVNPSLFERVQFMKYFSDRDKT